MDDRQRFERRLDKTIDRYLDDVDFVALEMLLQERAQEMRERAYTSGDRRVVDADDVEGWADE